MTRYLYAAALLACFFLSSFMAPAEYEKNQRAAELQMKRRLINKFPAQEFTAPVQLEEQP